MPEYDAEYENEKENKRIDAYVDSASKMFAIIARSHIFPQEPIQAIERIEEIVQNVCNSSKFSFHVQQVQKICTMVLEKAFKYMLTYRAHVLDLEVEKIAHKMVLLADLSKTPASFIGAYKASVDLYKNVSEFILEITNNQELTNAYMETVQESSRRKGKWKEQIYKHVVDRLAMMHFKKHN